MARILIAGFGDVGSRLGAKLADAGHQVFGVRRKLSSGFVSNRILCIAADLCQPSTFSNLPSDVEYIVYILSPDSRHDLAYRNAFIVGLENLFVRYRQQAVRPSCLFVSSSSVYGQYQGEWVDESSPARSRRGTAQVLIEAEAKVLAEKKTNVVVRFTGIYGPGREHLIRSVREGKVFPEDPPRYTNRIHRDDCVGALYFLLQKQCQGESLDPVYLATDDEPAPANEVADWIARRLGISTPGLQSASLQTTNTVISNQNKRCSNRHLKALGYRLLYPSYREGYDRLIGMDLSA